MMINGLKKKMDDTKLFSVLSKQEHDQFLNGQNMTVNSSKHYFREKEDWLVQRFKIKMTSSGYVPVTSH